MIGVSVGVGDLKVTSHIMHVNMITVIITLVVVSVDISNIVIIIAIVIAMYKVKGLMGRHGVLDDIVIQPETHVYIEHNGKHTFDLGVICEL